MHGQLPCILQGTRYSAWPWCVCISSTESGSEEAVVGRESAGFQDRASLIFTAHEGDAGVPEQPGGRERAKPREKKDAFEKWAGEWSQEGKWGDGGEKTEVPCSLVWQHRCQCLEGEKEAELRRERESLLTDLFLILSLSYHNPSPRFLIAFPSRLLFNFPSRFNCRQLFAPVCFRSLSFLIFLHFIWTSLQALLSC